MSLSIENLLHIKLRAHYLDEAKSVLARRVYMSKECPMPYVPGPTARIGDVDPGEARIYGARPSGSPETYL